VALVLRFGEGCHGPESGSLGPALALVDVLRGKLVLLDPAFAVSRAD
jgi:hypothetical protein